MEDGLEYAALSVQVAYILYQSTAVLILEFRIGKETTCIPLPDPNVKPGHIVVL